MQSATPSYYIPKATISSRLTPIVKYYSFEPIPALNPTVVDSDLKRNQVFN
jgi:hypothetical protein